MKRREFITLLGGVAAWPITARAQQRAMPVIGFLHSASSESRREQVVAYREGLNEGGFVEGRNASIEYRWAENQYHKLPELLAAR
jgi:putative ABC transport system substrate-binding protein